MTGAGPHAAERGDPTVLVRLPGVDAAHRVLLTGPSARRGDVGPGDFARFPRAYAGRW
ncbi:MAG: hypothetical protein ACE5E6_07505 [Phycisphaerae bacterium]